LPFSWRKGATALWRKHAVGFFEDLLEVGVGMLPATNGRITRKASS
jgi:hypothetical protein